MREQTIGTGISAAMALVLVITGCAGDVDDTAGGAAAAAATTTTSPVEVVGTGDSAIDLIDQQCVEVCILQRFEVVS